MIAENRASVPDPLPLQGFRHARQWDRHIPPRDSRVQCCAKRQVPADTKSHGAEREARRITLHVVAGFEVIEHGGSRGIEMRYRRGMGQRIALHATRVVISDDQAGWASSMIDLGCRHDETMPGQSVCRTANRPGELKVLRVQNDPGISGTRLRSLWRCDISSTGKAVDGELDVSRSDLHVLRLPQTDGPTRRAALLTNGFGAAVIWHRRGRYRRFVVESDEAGDRRHLARRVVIRPSDVRMNCVADSRGPVPDVIPL